MILHLLQKSEVETQPDYQVTMIQEETFSSELFRYLVTEAYGKDYSEVTEEELAELIYLKIDYENGEEYIEYQRIGKERARSVIPKEKEPEHIRIFNSFRCYGNYICRTVNLVEHILGS